KQHGDLASGCLSAMASSPNLDDDENFDGDYVGNILRSKRPRTPDDDEDFKEQAKEEHAPGAATRIEKSKKAEDELEKWRSSFQNESFIPTGTCLEPGLVEHLKPQEDKNEEDRSKVDDLRGSPMSVRNLEELIGENHAIVLSSVGPEYYVRILSFVDKDQLEPDCAILMHNKVLSVVGLLQDEKVFAKLDNAFGFIKSN
ncbi:hypothetical protein KI387_010156, partial [Taxus chinensis]